MSPRKMFSALAQRDHRVEVVVAAIPHLRLSADRTNAFLPYENGAIAGFVAELEHSPTQTDRAERRSVFLL